MVVDELVSAVVITYKRKPEIVQRAVKSVLSQTYRPLEIIVVDDSPCDYELRDQVKKAVEAFEEKICYIQHEKNCGACVARNTGLKYAHGKYIAFLDDDDEWASGKIEKQVAAFNNEETALVYCPICVVNDKTGDRRVKRREFYEGSVYPELMRINFIGSTSFPLIRRKMLEDIGGFDPLMPASQDYDVWLRLARKYKISFVDEPLGIYHWHEGEQITKNPEKKLEAMERIDEKNREFIEENRRIKWYRTIYRAPVYAKNRQPGKALTVWGRAVVQYPLDIYTNITFLLRTIKGYYGALSQRKRR